MDFIMLRYVCSLHPYFGEVFCFSFNQEWMLTFVKWFFCIYWDDHVAFFWPFVNVLYYTDWFVDIKSSLNPWNKANLITIYDIGYISGFGNNTLWKCLLFSHVWLFGTLCTVTCQVPLSMGFSRQKDCGGKPFPSPGDHPDRGIEPRSSALQSDSLPPVWVIREAPSTGESCHALLQGIFPT